MLRVYTFTLLLMFAGAAALAQTPELIADLNTGASNGLSQYNTSFFSLGNKILLEADNGQTGLELFVLENNTLSLLKDIASGTTSSQPDYMTIVGDKMYFVATDSLHGRELWVTDGTPAGTTVAQDLTPGTGSGNPKNLVASTAGMLFFERNHKVYAMTPGSAPVLIPGAPYVNLDQDFNTLGNTIVPYKNGVAFAASPDMFIDSTYVFVSDGTPAGTRKAAAFVGTFSGGIFSMIALKEKVLFVIENGYSPEDAVNGIYAVSGVAGEPATGLLVAGNDDYKLAYRVMATDGNKAYFYTLNGMYVTDGTPAGTVKLTNSLQPYISGNTPYPFAFLQGKALFQASAGSFSSNIMASDGTVPGTSVLKTIDESFVEQFVRYRDKIFFVSGIYNGFTPKIWESDLTAPGTKSLFNYTVTSADGPSIIILGFKDDYLYFHSNLGGVGRELYRIKITIGVSTGEAPAAKTPYTLEQVGTGEYRISGGNDTDRLMIRLFDLQGRALQEQWVDTGTTFKTVSLSGMGVLTVEGQKGAQSFRIWKP